MNHLRPLLWVSAELFRMVNCSDGCFTRSVCLSFAIPADSAPDEAPAVVPAAQTVAPGTFQSVPVTLITGKGVEWSRLSC